MSAAMPASSIASRAFSAALGAALGLMALATLIVMRSELPPVFNQSFERYRAINAALLLVLSLAGALLLAAAATGRWQRLASLVKLLAVWLLTVELALVVFDRSVISVNGSPLPNAFRNATVEGQPVFLHQSTPNSRFGFDTPQVEPPVAAGTRVLFLGNSYLRGLGTAGAPSYPRAVDAELKRLTGRSDVSVFSAGVSGAGVRDDLYLYKLLLEQGYRFDAVVLNLMMQSDLTNNMPGTLRRAVAGQPQRFQESAFLRAFYPLNSTLFRYLVYFQVSYWQDWAPDQGPALDASCTLSPGFAAFIRERAQHYYGPGAQRRVYLDYNVAQALQIRQLAASRGTPMFTVLLPDPNAGLDAYRQRLGEAAAMDWEWTRAGVKQGLEPAMPVLDLAPDFRNRYASYRCNDTHWTPQGNREGGERVARWLAEHIATPRLAVADATKKAESP